MAKIQRKQIALGQNFLRSAALVRGLLGESSIGVSDAVLEIGAGRGIITAELARLARKVVALEKDPALVGLLRVRFSGVPNVEILEGDFLQYRISDREYKIFANIPFNRTAEIVRKILCASSAPSDAYLILQKEAAEKFSGSPAETRFSILARPRFQIQIMRELRRTDFEPMPGVDSVMLRIQKRSPALVLPEDDALFQRLVCYGFAGWKRSLGKTFQHIFSYRQWKRLSKELCFPLSATPSELTFEQWLGLLDCLKRRVPPYKQMRLQIESLSSQRVPPNNHWIALEKQ
jgi:23S rRNA (adenine-N6)-dimethyltransferase